MHSRSGLAILATLVLFAAAAEGQARDFPLEDYRARQGDGVEALDALARALPGGLWLDRLEVSGMHVHLVGRAFNTNAVAELIGGMERSPSFEGAVLRQSTQQPDKLYLFVVDLKPDPQARALDGPQTYAHRAEAQRVTERLRAELRAPGIRIESFAPEPLEGFDFQVLPIKARIVAASYKDLYTLCDRLARFSLVVAFRRLHVVRDPGREGSLAVDLALEIPLVERSANSPGSALPSRPMPPGVRSDPFRVLTHDGPRWQVHPEGIAGLLLVEIEIKGVFRSGKGWVAQVKARKTGKAYLVKAGDQLYDAEVVRVSATEVVFLQDLGKPGKTREVILGPPAH